MARCKNCNTFLKNNETSIQQFAESMYKNIQTIQYLLSESERYKKRIKRLPNLFTEYEQHKENLRCVISEYLYSFENPYYGKVKIHIPEADKAFKKFKLYLQGTKVLKEL